MKVTLLLPFFIATWCENVWRYSYSWTFQYIPHLTNSVICHRNVDCTTYGFVSNIWELNVLNVNDTFSCHLIGGAWIYSWNEENFMCKGTKSTPNMSLHFLSRYNISFFSGRGSLDPWANVRRRTIDVTVFMVPTEKVLKKSAFYSECTVSPLHLVLIFGLFFSKFCPATNFLGNFTKLLSTTNYLRIFPKILSSGQLFENFSPNFGPATNYFGIYPKIFSNNQIFGNFSKNAVQRQIFWEVFPIFVQQPIICEFFPRFCQATNFFGNFFGKGSSNF